MEGKGGFVNNESRKGPDCTYVLLRIGIGMCDKEEEGLHVKFI